MAAKPTAEERADEFSGTIYGAVALDEITVLHTYDALDALHERCPRLLVGEAGKIVRRLEGGGGSCGLLRLLGVNMEMTLQRVGKAWIMDFGNAAYEKALPHIERLQYAVGNHLGRHKVTDITAFSRVIVAQSLAAESASYVERRQKLMRNCLVTAWDRRRISVPFTLGLLSCRSIERALSRLARVLIEPNSVGDIDLFTDQSVIDGCKAVVNVLGDVNTWIYARDKADELNNAS